MKKKYLFCTIRPRRPLRTEKSTSCITYTLYIYLIQGFDIIHLLTYVFWYLDLVYRAV